MQPPVVEVTSGAAAHVERQLARRNKGLGVRLGIKKAGCSGFAYALEFVDESRPDDLCFQAHGIAFYVRPEHLDYLRGARLLMKREGLNEGLEFENPNAINQCGCGESFSVG